MFAPIFLENNKQITCHLQIQILATTVVTGKLGQQLFLPKNLILNSFQPKNTSPTSVEHLQTNSLTQNTQKSFKNSKSN
jgi:hypothetical protein